MKETKLVKLMEALTAAEFKKFRNFLHSDFYNTDDNLRLLYGAMKKHFPAFTSSKLTKEILFEKVFPGSPWQDAKWRNLSSKMVKLIEKFYAILELNEREEKQLLIKAYGRRQLYAYFEKECTNFIGALENQERQDVDLYKKRILAKREYYYHILTDKYENLPMLNSLQDDLDTYHQAEKNVFACDEIILKKNRKAIIAQSQKTERPAFYTIRKIVHEMLKENSKEAFVKGKLFLAENISKLNINDQRFGLLSLQNFAIGQVNLGLGKEFNPHIIELYKIGLEHKILFEKGVLPSNSFLNIVSTATALKEFEWSKYFIENYSKYLPPPNLQNVKKYALAIWHFQKGEYSLTIDLLSDFSSGTKSRILQAKLMLLRSYFSIFLKQPSYFDFFISYSTSFEKHIGRKGFMSPGRINQYQSISQLLRKIAKLKMAGVWNKKAKKDILELIANQPELITKSWLIEKIKTI